MEVLTAYVREHAPWKEIGQRSKEGSSAETPPTQSHEPRPKPTTDVQAILTVLGRRTRTYGKGEEQYLDLAHTDLRGAVLREAHLERANLWDAHLEGADLSRAHLEGAHFIGAHLEGADLPGAHLERVHLTGAHLEEAHLGEAHLERAHFRGAYLEGTDLEEAHLKEADFWGAHLQGAKNLTVEQLSTVKTLYGAELDPPSSNRSSGYIRNC
jgi:Pentapeptide repeats (8 copies)